MVQAQELLTKWLARGSVALCEPSEGEGELWVVLSRCIDCHGGQGVCGGAVVLVLAQQFLVRRCVRGGGSCFVAEYGGAGVGGVPHSLRQQPYLVPVVVGRPGLQLVGFLGELDRGGPQELREDLAARLGRLGVEVRRGRDGFENYMIPAAIVRLKQGFGRLIRTRKDAGLVALLDRRAVRKGYGKSLLASLPPARRVRSLDDVREFWHDIDSDE